MLSKGPAKKVIIYVNEDTQHHLTALSESIMTFLSTLITPKTCDMG